MDLRDYLRILRRGAPTIVVFMVLTGLLSVLYLQATPKVYQAQAAILVAPSDPRTLGDLQIGSQYAQTSTTTIANLIGTASVLVPVAQDLRADGTGASLTADELRGLVTASTAESSAVVYITSSAAEPRLAARIANTVAERAVTRVPELVSTQSSPRAPLLGLDVVQSAQTPGAPSAPNVRRIVVLFLAVGLALGLAVALVRQSLDRRLRRSEDVAGVTPLPLLATLARSRRAGRATIVVRDSPASPSVEGYRVLRTNLGALGTDQRGSVLVAAVSHDPTAVQVPVNLAWSLAKTGRRVLLIDLDLRHTSIASLFDIADRPGAADVLTERAVLGDVIAPTSLPTLQVIPGGVSNQAPSDLLSSLRFDAMMADAEADYDHVVIHAPPLLSYTDAAVVARRVSQVVVLVRSGHTQGPNLTRAIGVLSNVGVTPLGVVLSDARVSVVDNVRSRGSQSRPSTPTGRLVGRPSGGRQ